MPSTDRWFSQEQARQLDATSQSGGVATRRAECRDASRAPGERLAIAPRRVARAGVRYAYRSVCGSRSNSSASRAVARIAGSSVTVDPHRHVTVGAASSASIAMSR